MNGENDIKRDFTALKKLLVSWHVEILYNLFKEEDIDIEELKMMQFHHINSLLKNYKMGVRIRFEYNLNNWRNKIGIPLKEVEMNPSNNSYCNFNKPVYENEAEENTAKKRKSHHEELLVNHEFVEIENNQPLPQSHDTKSGKPLNQSATCKETALLPVSKSPTYQTHTDDEGENESCSLSNLGDFLATTLEEEEAPNFPSKPTHDKCPASLRQILELSGTRGISIINFYNERKHLTSVQRGQLIQIIVDFFDENDYHLSLNMSHNLEWEILKMFPNEKLEYYRTEKRGKIYVKYSNMKRYKRERNIKSKAEADILSSRTRRSINRNHQSDVFNVDNNTIADNDDNEVDWSMSAESEIKIKEENVDSI